MENKGEGKPFSGLIRFVKPFPKTDVKAASWGMKVGEAWYNCFGEVPADIRQGVSVEGMATEFKPGVWDIVSYTVRPQTAQQTFNTANNLKPAQSYEERKAEAAAIQLDAMKTTIGNLILAGILPERNLGGYLAKEFEGLGFGRLVNYMAMKLEGR